MDEEKTYAEKLRDPRWQKRRAEICDAAGWRCVQCGDDTEELNVHHKEYLKDHEPWDYHSSYLRCLCRTCHIISHLPVNKLIAAHETLSRSDPAFVEEFLGRVLSEHILILRKMARHMTPKETRVLIETITAEYLKVSGAPLKTIAPSSDDLEIPQ